MATNDLGDKRAAITNTVAPQKGLAHKFATWLLDTYFPDTFVPREDFDHVQAREFPIFQRDLAGVRAERDYLLRENHKLICLGLHNHAFLPTFLADDGQIDVAVTTHEIREQFLTRVCVEVSDDYRRAVRGRLRPGVFDYLAKVLVGHVTKELKRKFEPPFPGKAPSVFNGSDSDSASY